MMPDETATLLEKETVCIPYEGFSLQLMKEKTVWIKELNTLLIADLHFGKAAHFRKSGVPIPELIHHTDLARLQALHLRLKPIHTIFLGDLFHSDWNSQWDSLLGFLEQFSGTQFHLVKGNHDVLSPILYRQSLLRIHEKPLTWGKFILSHEPMERVPPGQLNLCGHVHPGVKLMGKARQSVRIPCFYRSGSRFILPAFGNFTGTVSIRPKEGDWIWGVVREQLISLHSGTGIG